MKLKDLKHNSFHDLIYFTTPDGEKGKIEIWQDEDALNPRDFGGNIGTMVCWHNNYCLGDDNKPERPREYVRNLLNMEMGIPYEDMPDDLNELFKMMRESDGLAYKFLYLFDHSGISISTSDFNDPWDSGRVGFIWTTRSRVQMYYDDLPDDNWKETAYKEMDTETAIYNNWIQGDSVGYTVYINKQMEEKCPHCGEVVKTYTQEVETDSCGSFYEYNELLDYLIGHYGNYDIEEV